MLEMAMRENSAMDNTVARLNIDTETDETRRQMIARLLAEEEAKLSGLENMSKKRKTAR
jgi:hypothetical protein